LLGARSASLKDSKVELLQLALDTGAKIPASAIQTEIPAGTLGHRERVAKAVNAWEQIKPGVYFNTHLLEDRDSAHLELPARPQGPVFFQGFIEHKFELRIYLAGAVSFAVEIDSRAPEVIDFRMLDRKNATARVIEAPTEIESLGRELMSDLGLNYCVFDVLVGADGGLWLVDVTPTGVWNYLEKDFGLSLTKYIVNGALSL
jgi:hypothetical protein